MTCPRSTVSKKSLFEARSMHCLAVPSGKVLEGGCPAADFESVGWVPMKNLRARLQPSAVMTGGPEVTLSIFSFLERQGLPPARFPLKDLPVLSNSARLRAGFPCAALRLTPAGPWDFLLGLLCLT